MKVRSETGDIVAEFLSISRVRDKLVIDTKMLGSMRMDMVITPQDIIDGLKMLLSLDVMLYVLLMPYFGIKRLLTNNREHKCKEERDDKS